ncbi:MAG: hypothetical protein V4490_04365 [Pseudomonadota bacterium]
MNNETQETVMEPKKYVFSEGGGARMNNYVSSVNAYRHTALSKYYQNFKKSLSFLIGRFPALGRDVQILMHGRSSLQKNKPLHYFKSVFGLFVAALTFPITGIVSAILAGIMTNEGNDGKVISVIEKNLESNKMPSKEERSDDSKYSVWATIHRFKEDCRENEDKEIYYCVAYTAIPNTSTLPVRIRNPGNDTVSDLSSLAYQFDYYKSLDDAMNQTNKITDKHFAWERKAPPTEHPTSLIFPEQVISQGMYCLLGNEFESSDSKASSSEFRENLMAMKHISGAINPIDIKSLSDNCVFQGGTAIGPEGSTRRPNSFKVRKREDCDWWGIQRVDMDEYSTVQRFSLEPRYQHDIDLLFSSEVGVKPDNGAKNSCVDGNAHVPSHMKHNG